MSVFYSCKYDVVLFHNPKCGGISIRKGAIDGTFEGPFYWNRFPLRYPLHRSFGCARHPLNRFASAMRYLKNYDIEEIIKECNKFIENGSPDDVDGIDPIVYRDSISRVVHHFLPQTHKFNAMGLARIVMRFENLSEDFEMVKRAYNLDVSKLPHLNSTGNLDWRYNIPKEHVNIVVEFLEKDFEFYGYKLP